MQVLKLDNQLTHRVADLHVLVNALVNVLGSFFKGDDNIIEGQHLPEPIPLPVAGSVSSALAKTVRFISIHEGSYMWLCIQYTRT